ncbi:MAG TPA: phage major capsid protein, P2 family [Gallibacterium anatis]|uniref:Phage major capsid protein, P2 family n=1 Tax=Gallibacterium anatis TaxID=750 RepID=A0A921L2F1_9PAST|nr:phage major capsid protein, P2 family [Gallibacterium anatis]
MKNRAKINQIISEIFNDYSSQPISNIYEHLETGKQGGIEFIKTLFSKSDFFNQINLVLANNLQGNKFKGVITSPATGRREARQSANLGSDGFKFELQEVDTGVAFSWNHLDSLADLYEKDLKNEYLERILSTIVFDILQIGWNGKNSALMTENADLSDVDKGWLKLLAEQKPENIIQQGKEQNIIKVFGENADYKTLSELAFALKSKLLPHHQQRNDLFLMIGRDLISKQENLLIDTSKAIHNAELESIKFQNVIAGLPVITPPNFPAKGAAITTLSNLSFYIDPISCRFSIKNDEEKKQLVYRFYRRQCYVVEDLNLMAAVNEKNIILS